MANPMGRVWYSHSHRQVASTGHAAVKNLYKQQLVPGQDSTCASACHARGKHSSMPAVPCAHHARGKHSMPAVPGACSKHSMPAVCQQCLVPAMLGASTPCQLCLVPALPGTSTPVPVSAMPGASTPGQQYPPPCQGQALHTSGVLCPPCHGQARQCLVSVMPESRPAVPTARYLPC